MDFNNDLRRKFTFFDKEENYSEDLMQYNDFNMKC